MDKVCEYCKVLRPVVYCKADSANLCLQCDAKIHSANALSNRHSRTLVCELCRCHWAYIQCSTHQMFMCRSCDRSQHNVSSQHQRRVISSYTGCPSAKDLAALWGFDLNGLDDSTHQDNFFATSCVSADTGAVNCKTLMQSCPQVGGSSIVSEIDSATLHSGAECEVGLSSKHSKAFYEGKQESTCFILQQIFDLKRLQTDDSNSSSFIRRQDHSDISSIESDSTWKLENNLDQHLQHFLGLDSEFELMGSPNLDLHVDPFPLPFSQLDHLTSSAPFQGDSIWQCKSPVQSGQLWSQNMQDLGVCEELGYLDELSMPDIDLTFQNFEELFGGSEQEPTKALPNDISMACAIVEEDARGVEDTSVATSGCATQSAYVKKDVGPSDISPYLSRIWDCSHPIRPSYSALSFSLSMHSAERSGTDYIDTGLQKLSCNLLDQESAQPEAKEVVITSYKDKKKV